VLDWQVELQRIEPRLLELPDAARRAIREVVAAFLREDGSADSLAIAHAA
jgi:hypothetical protein